LAEVVSKVGANCSVRQGMSGPDLTCRPAREDSGPNYAVPGAWSRTGENPPYGIFGGAAGNVATGAVDWGPRRKLGIRHRTL